MHGAVGYLSDITSKQVDKYWSKNEVQTRGAYGLYRLLSTMVYIISNDN